MVSCYRAGCIEHALQCFSRLVAVLLGNSAVARDKEAFGPQLEILGVDLVLGKVGFRCRPSKSKKEKWVRNISAAVMANKLQPGFEQRRQCM